MHEAPGRRDSTSTGSSTWSWKEVPHERPGHDRLATPSGRQARPTSGPRSAQAAAGRRRHARGTAAASGRCSARPVGRNLGLVVALLILCVVGALTAGDNFASVDNVLTILRLASVIGVVTVGMTFVIIGGGIDLSVGAIVALASVWCDDAGDPDHGRGHHWIVICAPRSPSAPACGLVNGLLIAYGRLVPFIATLAMLVSARGLAEIIADQQTQIVARPRLQRLLPRRRARHPAAGHHLRAWSRSSAGCCSTARPSAAAPSPSAATPRRPGWPASTSAGTPLLLYVLVRPVLRHRRDHARGPHDDRAPRPTATLYELDAIAAVIIGGTLLTGGRGTIVGTVLGVLDLHHDHQHLHPQQPVHRGPEHGQGRHHRRRRPAPAATGGAQQHRQHRSALTRPVADRHPGTTTSRSGPPTLRSHDRGAQPCHDPSSTRCRLLSGAADRGPAGR